MAIFLTVYPRDFATGTPFEVKATSSGDDFYVNRAGGPWLPALTEQTTLKRDFFDGDFSRSLAPPSASLKLSVPVLAIVHPEIARARWAGAKVVIEFWDGVTAETLFTGVVSGFNQQGKLVTLTAEIDTEPFDADALTAEYAGTTGIEGVADLEGNPKPLLLGRCYGVEPVLIDVVDNVYQVSAYGPIESVTAVYERGASFGDKVGDYANYAALIAADIKEGQWGSCLAQGLFRLGAPAYGVITADVDGDKPSTWLKQTGEIIKRVCAIAGVSSGLIDAASLDAMDADKPYDIGIYITDQQSVLEVARRLCLPLNYQAGIDANGKLFALKISLASPAITLNAQGAAMPAVIDEPVEQNTSPPYKRIMMGYRRCWRVHNYDEIAAEYTLVERGDWLVTETYREGNIVSLADGSRWIYIAENAGDDAEPGTDALVWQPLAEAVVVDWSNVTGEGRPEDNADVTANAVPYLEPSSRSITLNSDYLGVINPDIFPMNFAVRRYRGDNDVSSTTTWSIVSITPSGAVTATVSNGNVSITAMTQNCSFIVRAARDGVTLDCLVSMTKNIAPPPNTGGGAGAGTTVTDNSFATFGTSTSHAAISDLMTVKTGATGEITFSCDLSLMPPATGAVGSTVCAFQWRWRTVGGSWNNITEISNDSAPTVFEETIGFQEAFPGSLTSSQDVTGLSASTDYEVQLYARRSSGIERNIVASGNAVAIGS